MTALSTQLSTVAKEIFVYTQLKEWGYTHPRPPQNIVWAMETAIAFTSILKAAYLLSDHQKHK